MKAQIKTEVKLHYLRSEAIDKKKYHFTFSKDGLLMNHLPLFAGSSIDGDVNVLHIGLWRTDNEIHMQWVVDLLDKLNYGPCVIDEVDEFEHTEKPSKKKK